MPEAKKQPVGLHSVQAEGVVSKYEVTHSRSRRGAYQGSKTRLVLVVPEDRGDEVAALQQQRCAITVTVLPPDQQGLFEDGKPKA